MPLPDQRHPGKVDRFIRAAQFAESVLPQPAPPPPEATENIVETVPKQLHDIRIDKLRAKFERHGDDIEDGLW